ncbi:MAG: tetratricopeptide repeat protein, partial [Myxococcota bacterium]
DNAAAALRTDTERAPKVRAQMAFTVGKVYFSLAQHQEAIQLLELSEAEARAAKDKKQEASATCELAALHSYLQKDIDKAKRALTSCYDLRMEVFGPDSPDTALATQHLAYFTGQVGDWAKSAELSTEAVRVLRKFPNRKNELVYALEVAGEAKSNLGQNDEALAYLNQALAVCKERGDDGKSQLAIVHNKLSLHFRRNDQTDLAIENAQAAVNILEEILGPEHPELAPNLNNVGLLLMDRGKPIEGMPYVGRAIAINKKALGPEHWTVGFTTRSLALVHLAAGNGDTAETLAREALEIVIAALGPGHLRTAQVRAAAAKILLAQGQPREASKLAEQAQTTFLKMMGPDSPDAVKNAKTLDALRSNSAVAAGDGAE